MSDRNQLMMDFLNQHLASGFWVESLAGDASFRRYHRIHFEVKSEQGKSDMTYLLMDAPPQKESVSEFVHVAGIMSEAVNVPQIIAKDMAQGFLLLQDFGTVEFAHKIVNQTQKDTYYKQALKTLIELQSIDIQVDLPPYDEAKLTQEMQLFSEWFLPYVDVSLDDKAQALWQKTQTKLVADIANQPKVIVHRDYHSRNLMIDKASQALGVIDFQDALIGAYTYDLVSLVRDAYIDIDEAWVANTIKDFYDLKAPTVSLEEFTKQTNIMGVQRHLKVLGIFIRLFKRDGKDRYLQNIPKVMHDLLVELAALAKDEPVYAQFLKWLTDCVVPAYEAVFKGDNHD